MSMLEIKDLSVTFGGLHALKNLDFRVEEGEIVEVRFVGLGKWLSGEIAKIRGDETAV